MRRENSILAEESSDEEQEEVEPDWILAMSSGEARKDTLVHFIVAFSYDHIVV